MASTLERATLRHSKELAATALVDLYESVGWTAYTEDPEQLGAAVRNSSFVVSAWEGDRLVGLARAVSDDVSVMFLHDVVVRPSAEAQGLRETLMEAVFDRYRHVRQKVFLCDGDDPNARLYRQLGLRNTRTLRRMSMDAWVRYEGFSVK